jgi:glucosamine-6-phosphate deaminase
MSRNLSRVAPGWWDYTTLDREILDDAAKLTVKDIQQLGRPGFEVRFYETSEEFYLAEALEYINAWQQATSDHPCGVCGPIGPTGHLPLVAQLVNALNLNLSNAHFWGMDEWVINGKAVSLDFPLGFAKADYDL